MLVVSVKYLEFYKHKSAQRLNIPFLRRLKEHSTRIPYTCNQLCFLCFTHHFEDAMKKKKMKKKKKKNKIYFVVYSYQ